MPGFGNVRPTREMQYLQAERDKETAPDPGVRVAGGRGASRFADIKRFREAYREAFPEIRATAAARAAQAGSPGQAGVHEMNNPGNEAGFFADFELPHSNATSMGYSPPGYVEAGHRRPEDRDPLAEAQYQRDYNYQQIARRQRVVP